jgi:hypothetical protein
MSEFETIVNADRYNSCKFLYLLNTEQNYVIKKICNQVSSGDERTSKIKHIGPGYRSEIKLIVIKCEIN